MQEDLLSQADRFFTHKSLTQLILSYLREAFILLCDNNEKIKIVYDEFRVVKNFNNSEKILGLQQDEQTIYIATGPNSIDTLKAPYYASRFFLKKDTKMRICNQDYLEHGMTKINCLSAHGSMVQHRDYIIFTTDFDDNMSFLNVIDYTKKQHSFFKGGSDMPFARKNCYKLLSCNNCLYIFWFEPSNKTHLSVCQLFLVKENKYHLTKKNMSTIQLDASNSYIFSYVSSKTQIYCFTYNCLLIFDCVRNNWIKSVDFYANQPNAELWYRFPNQAIIALLYPHIVYFPFWHCGCRQPSRCNSYNIETKRWTLCNTTSTQK